MRWRITQPGFEMAGKTGTAQVRRITKEERVTGVKKNESLPWNLRDHALFVAFAPVAAAALRLRGHRRAWRASAHPQVQMARDILLFAQQRDPLKLPTAYPVHAAEAASRQGDGHMTLRPYAAARAHALHRRQALRDQLGPGAADHHHRLHRLRDALFGGGRLVLALGRTSR